MEIEEYTDPRRSKLYEHEDLITEMRAKKWPLSKIVERLKTERGVKVAVPTLHDWCKRNGVKKGVKPVAKAKPQPAQKEVPKSASEPEMTDDELYESLVSSDESESPFTKRKPKLFTKI